jgi:muramidase (phage lysozyme)
MALGFFTDDNSSDSYETLQRRRKMADALMAQSQDGAPIQSWTQGGAKLIQALAGSLQNRSLDTKERESSKAFNEKLMRALGGQSGGAMPAAAPSPMPTSGSSLPAMASGGNIPKMVIPDPVYGNLDATQKALLNAIAAPESAGAYNIRYTPKGGATFAGFDAHPGVFEPGPAGPSSAAGRYQFTKTTWDRMGGGAFTPENQDQRALALANQDYKARTGRDLMADIRANGFTPQIAQALGPTWRGLIDNPQKAMAAFQSTMQRNQPAQAQVASAGGMTPDGMPTSPVPSNAPPMSYAPGQQAIASAAPQAPPQPAQGQRLAQAMTSPPIPAPQPTGNVQAAMMAVLTDPRFSPQQKQQAMQLFQMGQRDEGVTTVDLGDRVAVMNKRGQIVSTMPKTREGADWSPVKDADSRVVGRFNARTGQVENLPAPVGGGEDNRAPTVQRIKQPDGSEVAVQWDKNQRAFVPLNAPQGGNPVANPKLTEQQSKDVGFANRGEAILPRLEKQDKALTDSLSSLGGKVPIVGNYLKSDAYRQAEQTGRELLAVILRKDTGAAVTDSEMQMYSGMYLPQPGDDKDTIEQKRSGRAKAIEGIRLGLGPARILLEQQAALEGLKGGGQQAPAPQNEPPKVRRYNPQTGRIE